MVHVNHIALVVSDVGRSLGFYTQVLGLEQTYRPDFDRYGGWVSAKNVDIHLIKGNPVVHGPDNLIVGHIALEVENVEDAKTKLQEDGISYRINSTVPNPTIKNGVVNQIFVRDPDGYYIEFCECDSLHEYGKKLEEERRTIVSSFSRAVGIKEKFIEIIKRTKERTKCPNEIEDISPDFTPNHPVDETKLENLLKRRQVYGDIIQPIEEKELRKLLSFTMNDVPKLIQILKKRNSLAKEQILVPPTFIETDGRFLQPPVFKMPIS
ncbi:uncharacterized protein [Lepeophtheirus salmonis]|uniref:uncharacterized protein n=1 Tax=Lepeophtheirus salmonis TaxID=72036 RepID=UPI001AE181E4|nr:uncharacterized protein LOC121125197 [Lepeophtheirus salmonis]